MRLEDLPADSIGRDDRLQMCLNEYRKAKGKLLPTSYLSRKYNLRGFAAVEELLRMLRMTGHTPTVIDLGMGTLLIGLCPKPKRVSIPYVKSMVDGHFDEISGAALCRLYMKDHPDEFFQTEELKSRMFKEHGVRVKHVTTSIGTARVQNGARTYIGTRRALKKLTEHLKAQGRSFKFIDEDQGLI